MKSPVVFEEAPPPHLGLILGLVFGLISVVLSHGYGNMVANAITVAIVSLAALLFSFWTMRAKILFWLLPLVVCYIYYYCVTKQANSFNPQICYEK